MYALTTRHTLTHWRLDVTERAQTEMGVRTTAKTAAAV